MRPDHDPQRVFIVGMPRTGTNLLRNILNSAQLVPCFIGPETHFVGGFMSRGGRGNVQRIGSMKEDRNVELLVEAMFDEQIPGNYWRQLSTGRLGISREEMRAAILASDRSNRAIFDLLLRLPAQANGAEFVGEKTPVHLFHVPKLLEWFPQAKVIHTFRDPRAIYVSQIKKKRDKGVRGMQVPWEPGTRAFNFSLLIYTLSGWIYAARLHEKYERLYPRNYRLLQFEQVVSDPEPSLSAVCSFLGLEMEAEMLQPIRASSSYKHTSGSTGFDEATLTRWRSYINPGVNGLFERLAGAYLRDFGYEN